MVSIAAHPGHKGTASGGTLDVCLATKSFYPIYVGPAMRFKRYAPGLRERGIQLRVFTQEVTEENALRDGLYQTPVDAAAGLSKRAGSNSEEIDGIPVVRTQLPAGWGRSRAYFRQLFQYCEQRRHEIGVVQFLNVDLWSIPYALRLRRIGIGTVFTHTLLSDFSDKKWKRPLQRLHRRLQIDQVQRIVVSSSVMRRQLEDIGVSTRVDVISNGVDLERFRPVSDQDAKIRLRRKLGLGEDWSIILAIGPIVPRKGTDALVEAFARMSSRHPQSRLLLVGPRHDLGRPNLVGFRDRIRSVIRDAAAEDRVIFTGARNNIEEYLKAADIFVFPSRREGMPNVVPEAMGCQLPMVLTPFTGLPAEFGSPDKHYVLSDWDPAVLASSIEGLVSAPARRNKLGSAARLWAEQNLDVKRSLDEYAALYAEIRGEAARGFPKGDKA